MHVPAGTSSRQYWHRASTNPLQLTVRLPRQLAPDSENVQAFFQEQALDGGGSIEPSTEFGRGLEFCGEGHVELRVPHPIPGYRYGLRWPVRNDDTRGEQWHRLHAALRERHEDLRSVVDRALRRRCWREVCRVGIYLEDLEQIPHRLLCHGPAEDGFPFLTLRHERTLARCVYWGVPAFAFHPGPAVDAADILADERRLVVLPLLWSEQATHEALGVLRIAFLDLPKGVSEVAPWLAEAKLLSCRNLAASCRARWAGVNSLATQFPGNWCRLRFSTDEVAAMNIANMMPLGDGGDAPGLTGAIVNEDETWRVLLQYGEDAGRPLSTVNPLQVHVFTDELKTATAPSAAGLLESVLQGSGLGRLMDHFRGDPT